jgi:hypothetical protein
VEYSTTGRIFYYLVKNTIKLLLLLILLALTFSFISPEKTYAETTQLTVDNITFSPEAASYPYHIRIDLSPNIFLSDGNGYSYCLIYEDDTYSGHSQAMNTDGSCQFYNNAYIHYLANNNIPISLQIAYINNSTAEKTVLGESEIFTIPPYLETEDCNYSIGEPTRGSLYEINIQHFCTRPELLGATIPDNIYYTYTTELGAQQTEPVPYDSSSSEYTFITDISYGNILYNAYLVFSCNGTPCASLLLYDNSEGLHITTPPSINPLSGATIAVGGTYNETGTFVDESSINFSSTVDYGDGSGINNLSDSGNSFILSHVYTTPGTYTVTVTIRDNTDLTGEATATVVVINDEPATVTFNSSADSYVKSGQDNHNYGAGVFMNLQSSGNNRSIVKFDQSELQNAIGGGTVLSAKLQLTITDNGNNWGSTGRTVDLHRLIVSWDEGNGTENDRGDGNGATWNCASDSLIENQAKNCSGNTEWEMGQPNNPSVHPWEQTPSATQTITNNQSGIVEYDVTADVQAFLNGSNSNYGWLLKKTNEGQNGQVSFGTRESASAPQLVVTYQP